MHAKRISLGLRRDPQRAEHELGPADPIFRRPGPAALACAAGLRGTATIEWWPLLCAHLHHEQATWMKG